MLRITTDRRHWILALSHDPAVRDATARRVAHDVGRVYRDVLPLLRSNPTASRKFQTCSHSRYCMYSLHCDLPDLASANYSFCKFTRPVYTSDFIPGFVYKDSIRSTYLKKARNDFFSQEKYRKCSHTSNWVDLISKSGKFAKN